MDNLICLKRHKRKLMLLTTKYKVFLWPEGDVIWFLTEEFRSEFQLNNLMTSQIESSKANTRRGKHKIVKNEIPTLIHKTSEVETWLFSDLPINFISSIDIMVVTKGVFLCQCHFFYLHTQVSQSLKVVLIKLSTNLATILFCFFIWDTLQNHSQ